MKCNTQAAYWSIHQYTSLLHYTKARTV